MTIPDQTSAPQVESPPPTPPSEDIEAIKQKAAEFDRLQVELEKAKLDTIEKVKRTQEEAAKRGELQTAYEIAQKRIAELEAVAPKADLWEKHEQAELKRIEEQAANLPESFKRLLSAAQGLDAKRDVLAAFAETQPKQAPGQKHVSTPPEMGAPAPVSAIDFAEAIKDPNKLREAKEKDPKGFAEWFGKMLGPKQTQPLGVQRFVRK